MELIITPPQIAVRFRVSLMHSLLTTAGLLSIGDRLEGLSDWMRQAEARLQARARAVLRPLNMLILYATGIQGYLIGSVPHDHDANTDFEALWQHLEQLDPQAMQAATLQALHEYLIRRELMARQSELPRNVSALADFVRQLHQQHEARWESESPLLVPAETFAEWLLDAPTLYQKVLDGIWYLWHQVYKDQAAEDMAQHITAVAYHTNQDYQDDFSGILRAVTGRTLPQRLSHYLVNVDTVEMIPSRHIGAHITVAILGSTWWIGFNANLIPSQRSKIGFSPALYPALKALADETRLKMVTLLAAEELNVGDIADALALSQSTASRHLSLLAKTDILGTRREGTMRYYSLNREALIDVSERLKALSGTSGTAKEKK